jgi:serine phosphatase RsbU (regulator of sigma subunit)
MQNEKPTSEKAGSDRDDILRYDYHLSTMYDISRDLFGELDIEVILRNFLLSTMGIVGAAEGFILLADPHSRKVRRFVLGGCREVDRKGIQDKALEVLLDEEFDAPIVAGKEAARYGFLPQGTGCLLKFEIDGGHVGLMVLGAKLIGEACTDEEQKLLVTLKNNVVIALRNARSFDIINRLNEDLLEKKAQLEQTVDELRVAKSNEEAYSRHLEQIIAALNVAQEVQQSLLPAAPPEEDCFDIAGASLYCDETGGDYYDYIELPRLGPRVYALVVGDVSGHGISSALLMAGVRAYLRSRIMQTGSAADIINDVNHMVAADTRLTCQFMTLFFLAVDAANRRLSWVNAGHEPATVYHTDRDEFSDLGGKGIPLGVEESWEYKEASAALGTGQIVVLTTDGVWEVRNAEGEMFGKKRFREVIRRNGGRDAAGIRTAIVDAVTAFKGDASQEDDITLVVCKFS